MIIHLWFHNIFAQTFQYQASCLTYFISQRICSVTSFLMKRSFRLFCYFIFYSFISIVSRCQINFYKNKLTSWWIAKFPFWSQIIVPTLGQTHHSERSPNFLCKPNDASMMILYNTLKLTQIRLTISATQCK